MAHQASLRATGLAGARPVALRLPSRSGLRGRSRRSVPGGLPVPGHFVVVVGPIPELHPVISRWIPSGELHHASRAPYVRSYIRKQQRLVIPRAVQDVDDFHDVLPHAIEDQVAGMYTAPDAPLLVARHERIHAWHLAEPMAVVDELLDEGHRAGDCRSRC